MTKTGLTPYRELLTPIFPSLLEAPKRWLVTGAAGFIGSHLVEALLSLGQEVTGLDDLSSGSRENLRKVLELSSSDAPERFTFFEGSITDPDLCLKAASGVSVILHHAAIASVPLSIQDPVRCTQVNVEGFLHVLEAARTLKVPRLIYASSSAVYGDEPAFPKTEVMSAPPLSPYGLTKLLNELYSDLWERLYGVESIGLRYFNVFGSRQDPNGAYAAVIPRWTAAVLRGVPPILYGDGSATRDFCSVKNVVLANLLAATRPLSQMKHRVFNIASGKTLCLKELLSHITEVFAKGKNITAAKEPPRQGDILHSSASIARAQEYLGYAPIVGLEEELRGMASSL